MIPWIKDKLEFQVNCMNSQRQPAACYTDEIWIRNGRRVNSGKRHQKYSGRNFEILPSSVHYQPFLL